MSRVGQPTLQREQRINMAMKDLGPWVPDIDPRKQEKPCIITGSNFIDTLDGPQSYFSNSFYDYNYWDTATRGRIDSFRIAGTPYFILGTQTGLWYIDPVSGKKELLLNINTSANPQWPWTCAYVGTFYYFAQYNIGLWQYDPVNNTLTKIVTPNGDNVSYVAASYGRLIGLAPTNCFWSALDDGTNLTPSLSTAAGAQPLSMIGGNGMAISVIPDGFLVYTTVGVLKATYTQQAYVWAWNILPGSGGIKLFSPNAATYIPRMGSLSLDNTGLNLTREYNYQDYGIPQPWEIPMGDYIKKNIIQNMNQNLFGAIDVFYCLSLMMIFISFSSNTQEGVMTTTFVYSQISKKWGSFNNNNTGIFEVYDPVNNMYEAAFIGTDGYIRYVTQADFSYGFEPDPYGNSNPTLIDWVYRPGDTDEKMMLINLTGSSPVYNGYCGIKFSDRNPAFYTAYSSTGLFYTNYLPYSDTNNLNTPDDVPITNTSGNNYTGGSNINFDYSGGILKFELPLALPMIAINASLEIGPFQFPDQSASDETSAVETIMVGTTSLSNFVTYEDYMAETGSDDWNNDTGMEDWGFGVFFPNSYGLNLQDTDDGINDPIQGQELLTPFDDLGASQIFKPTMNSSVYHNLIFSADEAGQSFALKTIALTGQLTGILQSA